MRNKSVRRLTLVGAVALLFIVLFNSVNSDLAPAVANSAPDIDTFVETFQARPGFINTYFSPDGALYFEITEAHFGRQFLVLNQLDKTLADFNLWAGWPLGNSMMSFRMLNNKIQLIDHSVIARADEGTPAAVMVDRTLQTSVRKSYSPIAMNKEEGRYLIDMTRLFLEDWANLSQSYSGLFGSPMRVDPLRSEITSVKAFPENVEIVADLTMGASQSASLSTPLPDTRTAPVSYHYSIVALPEEPMKPRLADSRIGYFTTAYVDFSVKEGAGNLMRMANRWRLEKSDPYAEISEPVEPIVFYLEKTIPDELRPYFREGVEEWNKAFEQAGFKNAILAVDEPDDPDWDAADARYSSIRWVAAPGAGGLAIGPSDVDPRSGEILNADIIFLSSWFLNKGQEFDNYAMSMLYGLPFENPELEAMRQSNPEAFARMCHYALGMASELEMTRLALIADGTIGADDEIPVEYIGEALRYIVMHEVGHSLGLRHNFKASSAVPNDRLNDMSYTSEHGLSVSVMDYVPANIALNRAEQGHYFSHTVGAYDQWAIEWGYTPVGNESMAPHPELEAIALEHSMPEHAYGTDEDVSGAFALDPNINTWDLGSDPIAYFRDYTALIDTLWADLDERLVGDGEPYWPMRQQAWRMIYFKFLGMLSQAKGMGGMNVTRAHRGDPVFDAPLQLLSAAEQRAAQQYVLEAFDPAIVEGMPKELLSKLTLDRVPGFTFSTLFGRLAFPYPNIVSGLRHLVMTFAFEPDRLMRIRDNEYLSDEADPYTLGEHFEGFTRKIWGSELSGGVSGDLFQRELQSMYVDVLISIGTAEASVDLFNGSIDAPTPYVTDAKSLARADLLSIHAAIEDLLAGGVSSRVDEAHLMNIQHRIGQALDLN